MSEHWKCPKCGAILKKGFPKAKAVVIGVATCGSCGAKFQQFDIYSGKFDISPTKKESEDIVGGIGILLAAFFLIVIWVVLDFLPVGAKMGMTGVSLGIAFLVGHAQLKNWEPLLMDWSMIFKCEITIVLLSCSLVLIWWYPLGFLSERSKFLISLLSVLAIFSVQWILTKIRI